MQFYKKRDFGELISATFDFVKKYGKNYFKNYILLNGLILILLLVVFWFGFGELFTQIFNSNLDGQQFFFEQYFTENQGVLIGLGIVAFIIFVLLSLVSYSFPVLYMKRVAETGEIHVKAGDIANDIKSVALKFLIFFLGMLFIVTPIALVAFMLSGLLMMILVGFLLLMLFVPAMLNIVNFTLFDYYHTDRGFFSSLGYAFRAQFSKSFWKYWGSIAITYLLMQVISSIFTFLPMMLIFGAGFVSPSNLNPEDSTVFGVIVMVIYAVAIVLGFVLNNLLYINTGFMYYDSRTDLHRDVQFSEIESLGRREI